MPVENIQQDGVVMYYAQPRPEGGVLSEVLYAYPGDILEDESFTDEELKKIKDKSDPHLSRLWRSLTPTQAKTKLADRAELELLAQEAEELRSGRQVGRIVPAVD